MSLRKTINSLKACDAALGPEDEITLRAANNLGSVFKQLGQFAHTSWEAGNLGIWESGKLGR